VGSLWYGGFRWRGIAQLKVHGYETICHICHRHHRDRLGIKNTIDQDRLPVPQPPIDQLAFNFKIMEPCAAESWNCFSKWPENVENRRFFLGIFLGFFFLRKPFCLSKDSQRYARTMMLFVFSSQNQV